MMVPGSQRQLSVLSWISHELSRALDRGIISIPMYSTLTTLLVSTRSAAGDLLNPVLYDVPLPYVKILTEMVKLEMLFYSVIFGTMAQPTNPPGAANKYGDSEWTWIIGSSLFTFYFVYALQSLMDLHELLYNPFTEGPLCVPHEAVNEGFKALAEGLLAQSKSHSMNEDCEWDEKGDADTAGVTKLSVHVPPSR